MLSSLSRLIGRSTATMRSVCSDSEAFTSSQSKAAARALFGSSQRSSVSSSASITHVGNAPKRAVATQHASASCNARGSVGPQINTAIFGRIDRSGWSGTHGSRHNLHFHQPLSAGPVVFANRRDDDRPGAPGPRDPLGADPFRAGADPYNSRRPGARDPRAPLNPEYTDPDEPKIPGDDYTKPERVGGGRDDGSPTAYAVLAAAHLSLGFTFILAPDIAAQFMFDTVPKEDIFRVLFPLLGTGLVASGIGSWVLRWAADNHKMNQVTHLRLNLGLMTLSTIALGLHLWHAPVLSGNGLMTGAAVMVPTWLIAAYHYSRSSGHGLGVGPIAKSIGDDMKKLVTPESGRGAAYALLTAAFAGAGLGYLLAPEGTLSSAFGELFAAAKHKQEARFVWECTGAALLGLVPWTFSLKEAADEDRLHAPTPRLLNVGLAFASAGHLTYLYPVWAAAHHTGKLLTGLLGTWATALVTSVAGITYRPPEGVPPPHQRQPPGPRP